MRRRTSCILAGLLVAVTAAAPARAGIAVPVTGDSGNVGRACGTQRAVIEGSVNHVVFTGECRSLQVVGSRNIVFVSLGRGGTIDITGDYNQVIYTPGAPPPVTRLHGFYNTVVPGPVPSSPTTLVLDGTFGLRDVHCDSMDVIIRESDVRYVLRGGCRSVTVQGRGITIAAELMPAARLTIGGVGVVINYVLLADGAPPSVFVTVPHASATHMVRSGESAMLLPTVAALP